jgi:hypothetical protein
VLCKVQAGVCHGVILNLIGHDLCATKDRYLDVN